MLHQTKKAKISNWSRVCAFFPVVILWCLLLFSFRVSFCSSDDIELMCDDAHCCCNSMVFFWCCCCCVLCAVLLCIDSRFGIFNHTHTHTRQIKTLKKFIPSIFKSYFYLVLTHKTEIWLLLWEDKWRKKRFVIFFFWSSTATYLRLIRTGLMLFDATLFRTTTLWSKITHEAASTAHKTLGRSVRERAIMICGV